MQVFNVFYVNRGAVATITESEAVEIPALNYGVYYPGQNYRFYQLIFESKTLTFGFPNDTPT